jgi:glycosyltransferase involved in cell wall biosynthesis
MDKKITILHVIETLGLGGAEKSLVQTVNGMPGYRHVIVILQLPDTLKSQLKDAKLINLNCSSFFHRMKAVLKLIKIIKQEKADLVHAQLFHSTFVGRLASKGSMPFVFTLQSMLGEDLFKKDIFARILEKLTYSTNNYLIAVSNEALNDYKKYIKINPQRTTVIYNSIEEIFFAERYKLFIPGKKVRMIAVGNLKPLKNYDYILDALKEMPAEKFELDIYGDGTHRNFLQKRIDNEKLPVTLKGNVSDLHERVRGYDIYLHCSKYEGSSLAVFEAMACGLPLMVSDIPVLIENTGNFAIYTDLSNASDLAEKLIRIQRGELEVNELGEKGFQWVRTVAHPEVVLKQKLSFIKKCYNN